jgi:hypothetical protein
MEPVSAVITSLLAEHLAGAASGVLSEERAELLRPLFDIVRERLSDDEQASRALERLAEQPDSLHRRAVLGDHLDEIMRSDADFAASLTELAGRAAGPGVITSGAVAIGGDVHISGHVAAGRDIVVPPGPGDPDLDL